MSALGETARKVGRYFDHKAEEYDSRMSQGYYRLLREITWQHIRPFLPRGKGARVLDAGGATGYWSIRLAKAGYHALLLDVSERMLEVAEENVREAGVSGKVELCQGDVTDLRDFKEESFDAVLALEEPLSFSSDPEMALAEMALVARPGGSVAASMLNRFKATHLRKLLKKGDVDELEHFIETGRTYKFSPESGEVVDRRSFTPEEAEGLFIANGLEIVSTIARPVFANAVAPRLEDREVFSKVLKLEVEHNSNRSLWGSADVLEILAQKPEG